MKIAGLLVQIRIKGFQFCCIFLKQCLQCNVLPVCERLLSFLLLFLTIVIVCPCILRVALQTVSKNRAILSKELSGSELQDLEIPIVYILFDELEGFHLDGEDRTGGRSNSRSGSVVRAKSGTSNSVVVQCPTT